MRIVVFVFLILFSQCLLADDNLTSPAAITAPPIGVVTKLRGNVTFEGKSLKEGDIINKVGLLKTQDKAYIQIKIEVWKNFISVGPNSSMALNFSDTKQYTLEQGSCRWKTFANSSEHKGRIYTHNVAMGVRGTDFNLKYGKTLNETEIIMFDGEVVMENTQDKTNTVAVKKGQWGGLGGRYGQKIAPPINLPQSMLDTTEKSLD